MNNFSTKIIISIINFRKDYHKNYITLNLFDYRSKYKTYCEPRVKFSSIFEKPKKVIRIKQNIQWKL